VALSGAIVTITLLSIVAASVLPAFDKDIFERLMLVLGESEARVMQAGVWHVLNFLSPEAAANSLGIAIFAAGSLYTCWRLPLGPRSFAMVSLFVLSLLYQFNLFHLFNQPAHPVGFLTSIVLGSAWGLYLRAKQSRAREIETHYYELKLRNQELMDTRLTLLKQDEMERRILAGDLHDQVLNDLKQAVSRFDAYIKTPDAETEARIRTLLNQVMVEIREVMESLSPSVLDHLGLGAAIEDCLRRGADRSGFKVRFRNKVDNEELACLSIVEQGLLYRLVQESITNICKHAGASTVRAVLEQEEGVLVIRVADDGKGIDPAKVRGDSRGLRYMRYRADLIGATIGWRAGDDGKGTTVEIRINLADKTSTASAGGSQDPQSQGTVPSA
jgi:signal transduction histidine kinase